MQILRVINIQTEDGPRQIQLAVGDITDTPENLACDAIVVSSFPGNYVPTRTSVIGALSRKGLSVEDLARKKDSDLRKDFGCWLSHELPPRPGLSFKRLLCFETALRGQAPDVIGDLFRAIEPFALGPPYLQSVAIPLLGAGNQGYDASVVANALLAESFGRLKEGHPIKFVRLVARDERYFANLNDENLVASVEDSASTSSMLEATGINVEGETLNEGSGEERVRQSKSTIDVFISYSRKDQLGARTLADSLTAAGVTVFLDERNIESGASWQQSIFDALEECRCAAVLYSPDFISSKICKDEFNAAMILRRRRGEDFIFPLLIRHAELPAYMEMLNYVDCCTLDSNKSIRPIATALFEISSVL
jgi:hypothetical protein